MGNKFLASDIFERNYFKSYSEFYLALAMGNVLMNKGEQLDMSGMLIDADSIPSDMINYFKKLMSTGAITIGTESSVSANITDSNSDVDTSYFNEIPLTYEEDGTLNWSFEYARDNYGVYASQFLEFMKLGSTLIHLTAYHLIDVMQGKTSKKLIFHFDSYKAKSTFIYVNIYSILQTVGWLSKYIDLDVDFGDFSVDLDYSIFCNNGKVAGHHNIYSVEEKKKHMASLGMTEGSILALWERTGMCENNEYGRISKVSIIMLREVGDSFIGITRIALNKTKEEVREEYYDIPEHSRYLFVDLLDKKPHQESTELDICGIGVDDYFYDEAAYVTLLDNSSKVSKLITVDGKQAVTEMKEVDAIYWLLCQYDIDFNKELYKDMYMGGEDALWDKCHG